MSSRRRRSAALIVSCTVGAVMVLAGCTSPNPADSKSPAEPSTATSPTATKSPTADDEVAEPADDAADTFLDPATLIGSTLVDSPTTQHSVVDGTPLELSYVWGECVSGPGDAICDWSTSGHTTAGADGLPEPSSPDLLLLLKYDGEVSGDPQWIIVDALVTDTVDAVLESCGSGDGTAFYPADTDGASGTVGALAAWGPNEDRTALVELDAASVTCEYFMD